MKSVVKRLAVDSTGASVLEYAFLLGLIALSIVVAAGALGAGVNAMYERAAAAFPQAQAPAAPGNSGGSDTAPQRGGGGGSGGVND